MTSLGRRSASYAASSLRDAILDITLAAPNIRLSEAHDVQNHRSSHEAANVDALSFEAPRDIV